jgi:hypothetical protein
VAAQAERVDWIALSGNPRLPWSISLLERDVDRWDWSSLSRNSGLPWAWEFLWHFSTRWNYEVLAGREWCHERVLATAVDTDWIERFLA